MTEHQIYQLGDLHARWLESRKLSPETAVRYGIFTGEFSPSGGVTPNPSGNVLVFPFNDRGSTVNEKYRGPQKKFSQRTGGKRTFWNADVLDDPALQDGRAALIITEGEIDALTAIDCGFPFTVSVPDGAPGVPKGRAPDELDPIDPAEERAGKFEFLWNNRERLAKIKRFVIAVDNDDPGKRLAAELVRRLSASRCLFVTFPEGCKDLNEVVMKHGPEGVAGVLNTAQPYPVRGLYRLSEYPDIGPIQTYLTGWSTLDEHLKLFAGEFMVVTGIPGMGKSTWVLNLLSNLVSVYGWMVALFSPEMPTVPHLRDKLRRIYLGRANASRAENQRADDWIQQHFVFIDADPTGKTDEDYDLDWLLDRAADAVLRDGVNCLVVDPWNELEHARTKNESGTEYVGRAIRALKRFARQYQVAVIIIAHPTKEVGKEGKARVPTLYDIEGSAHWYNKCDHGIVVDWPDLAVPQSKIHIKKVRFDETGQRGHVTLAFDMASGRYGLLEDGSEPVLM